MTPNQSNLLHTGVNVVLWSSNTFTCAPQHPHLQLQWTCFSRDWQRTHLMRLGVIIHHDTMSLRHSMGYLYPSWHTSCGGFYLTKSRFPCRNPFCSPRLPPMFNFNYKMLFVIAVILYCPERGRHNIATSSVLQSQCSTFTSQRACLSNQLLNLKIALIKVHMWFARHAICQCFLDYMSSIFYNFFLK